MTDPMKLFEENKRLAYYMAKRFKDKYTFMNSSELRNAALYALWKSSINYKQEVGKFSIYAGLIIHRLLQRLCNRELLYRKHHRQYYIVDNIYDIKEDIVFNLKENNEYDYDELDKALYEITPDQVIALIMRSNGLKTREIGSQLGITKQAVSYNYYSGIVNLRKHLGVK